MDVGLQNEVHLSMKEEVRNMIENTCSIEKLIQGFEEVLDYVNGNKP